MSESDKIPLPNLEGDAAAIEAPPLTAEPDGPTTRVASDLEAVFDVPVKVSAVLGRARMDIGDLLKIGRAPCSNSTAKSARRSTFMSTTAWLPAAKSSWWKNTGSA